MAPMGTIETTFRKTKDDLADKVRKLLAKAEDPATTPEEAEAFTAKAQQMMTKYAIDLAMVADPATADRLLERDWVVEGPYATHKVSIINAVARANDCRVLYAELPRGRKRIYVVGFAGDVDWVETLTRSLEVQLAAALAAAVRAKPAGVHGRTYSVAFVQGFAVEISNRLHRARQAAVAKAERVEEEFAVRHPSTRTVHRQIRLLSWSGYGPGRAAGRRASLARGSVEGSRRRLTA